MLYAVQVLGLENGDPAVVAGLAVVGRIFVLDGVEEEEDAPVEVLWLLDRTLSASAGNNMNCFCSKETTAQVH